MRIALAAAVAMAALLGVAEARTWRVAPGPEAQTELQHALSGMEPGDTLRLDRGRYELTRGLTLAVSEVTIRGEGQDRTVLSFAGQRGDEAGLDIRANTIVLRDFAVEDASEDGVAVHDCNHLNVRGMRVDWPGGRSRAEHRAYDQGDTDSGLSVVNCSNVLIEDTIVRGAGGPGIGVSQSRTVILQRNVAEQNEIGVSLHNNIAVDASENIVRQNGAGFSIFNSPIFRQSDGHSVRIFSNTITDNGAGYPGRSVPIGAGVFVGGARDVHVFDNDIGGSSTANVIVMANPETGPDPAYSPLPRDVMIRDNRFGASGNAPAGDFATLAQGDTAALADVIWDGATTYYSAGGPRTEIVRIVMRDNRSASGGIGTFLSLGLNVAGAPLSEAAPNPAYPPLLDLPEPERVRIED